MKPTCFQQAFKVPRSFSLSNNFQNQMSNFSNRVADSCTSFCKYSARVKRMMSGLTSSVRMSNVDAKNRIFLCRMLD